ncbi:MAG: orotate phosphoribosyltransferase [Clostridiales bacterium]|nr:orotate phosphoribosyltransferase [Candidatus Crickella caballi]
MKSITEIQNYYGPKLAKAALSLGAIKLSPEEPFTWASGYRMPIYNDNRQFLAVPECRALIRDAFAEMVEVLGLGDVDNISGTATAGIPHATTLADKLGKPMSYVRSSAKDHGMGNQIEGLAGGSFNGQKVLLIEDLISTGSSSIKAIEAIRQADGLCDICLAIFTYGLDKATDAFAALDPKCSFYTILNYDTMLQTALADGYISEENAESLRQWRESPFTWGESNGFPKEK